MMEKKDPNGAVIGRFPYTSDAMDKGLKILGKSTDGRQKLLWVVGHNKPAPKQDSCNNGHTLLTGNI